MQKATAPKYGVEFHQGSLGAIRSSLATSYDVQRRRVTQLDLTNQRLRNLLHRQADRHPFTAYIARQPQLTKDTCLINRIEFCQEKFHHKYKLCAKVKIYFPDIIQMNFRPKRLCIVFDIITPCLGRGYNFLFQISFSF